MRVELPRFIEGHIDDIAKCVAKGALPTPIEEMRTRDDTVRAEETIEWEYRA